MGRHMDRRSKGMSGPGDDLEFDPTCILALGLVIVVVWFVLSLAFL